MLKLPKGGPAYNAYRRLIIMKRVSEETFRLRALESVIDAFEGSIIGRFRWFEALDDTRGNEFVRGQPWIKFWQLFPLIQLGGARSHRQVVQFAREEH